MSTLRATLLLGLTGVSSASLGCHVFDPSLVSEQLGSDGRPPKPDIPDDGTDTGTLSFRITDVQLNSQVNWSTVGRNLDRYETTLAAIDQRQCDPPSGAAPPTDGPGGIDNAMGAQLLSIVEIVLPCLEGELSNAHLRGEGTLIIRVTGWNGMANDSVVQAALLVAADGTSAAPADVEWDAATHQLVLASDGTTPAPDPTGALDDYYVFRPDSFSGGSSPIARLVDNDAYVSDGAIVMEIPEAADLPLNAGIGSLTIKITDGLMVAQMNESLDAIADGTFSGRFSLVALLDAGAPIGICGEDAQRGVEDAFQDYLDVKSSADAAPGGPCDAMSLGIPFLGTPMDITFDGSLPARAGTNPPLPNACDRQPGDPPLCPS